LLSSPISVPASRLRMAGWDGRLRHGLAVAPWIRS
jgi:hypothetical protein